MNNVIPFRAPVRRDAGLPPQYRVRPAGQVSSWAPAGTPYFTFADDSSGHQVDLDASGRPISGTVVSSTSDGTSFPDSAWTGDVSIINGQPNSFYTGGGPAVAGSTSTFNLTAALPSISATLGVGLGTLQSIITGSDQNARDALAQQTQLQITTLNNQAAAARQAGDTATANARLSQANALAQFQAQAGLTQSSNLMTTVLIGVLGVALIGGVIYAVTRSDGSSARRSSARRNPSRGHRRGKRKHRRHRRAA